jgi:Uri superfamily endonuclease
MLNLAENQHLPGGALGVFLFPAGNYVYLGSARGPGGLQARLSRHLHGSVQLHWHIDWLREKATVTGFACLASIEQVAPMRLECHWSQRITALPGSFIPCRGFGASDCRSGCQAHCIGLGSLPLSFAIDALAQSLPASTAQLVVRMFSTPRSDSGLIW